MTDYPSVCCVACGSVPWYLCPYCSKCCKCCDCPQFVDALVIYTVGSHCHEFHVPVMFPPPSTLELMISTDRPGSFGIFNPSIVAEAVIRLTFARDPICAPRCPIYRQPLTVTTYIL